MGDWLQALLDWVSANPHWAGVVTFLMAFVESLAVVGMMVPGVVVMFAVGTLIGAGALDFWAMVAWAVAGAAAGDSLSFWLGQRYQQQLTSIWPFSKHPSILDKGIAFFQRYGGKSVALGRFFGPIRAVIPLVAGMMNMPRSRFLLANVASALVWAPVYLLPGVVFGASLELASEVAMRLAILLIVLLALLWFLGWLSHRLFLLMQPHSKALVQQVLHLGDRYKPFRRMAHALADPDHPEAGGLALLAGTLILGTLVLALISLIPQAPMNIANNAIHLALDNLATPAGDHLMLSLSAMAGSSTLLALLFIGWILFLTLGLNQAARHWLIGIATIWVIAALLEYLYRQAPQLIPLLPDIFVLRAAVFFPLAAVMISSPVEKRLRWLIYSTATILVASVLLAQLYLGSTLNSVLLALGGGLLWSSAVGLAYRTHAHAEPPSAKMAWLISPILLLVLASVVLSTPAPPARQQLFSIEANMSQDRWWRDGWTALPLYRDDVLHQERWPMNIQLSLDMAHFLKQLQNQGWHQAQPSSGINWLSLLAGNNLSRQLPVLPHSHRNHLQQRVLTKTIDDDSRLALFLWPSHFLDTDTEQPIWIGELVEQSPRHWLNLFRYPVSKAVDEQTLIQLGRNLERSGYRVRVTPSPQRLLVSDH